MKFTFSFLPSRFLLVLLVCLAGQPAFAEVSFTRGSAAHVVASPKSPLEQRITEQLTDYLGKVLGQPARLVTRIEDVPSSVPAILLFSTPQGLPLDLRVPEGSPEAFSLATGRVGSHEIAVAGGRTELGLKQAIHRLVIKSRQDPAALVIPDLNLSEKPWIPQREYTVAGWGPQLVRGVFTNPNADSHFDIWRYTDEQLEQYVNMFDWFGYSGCQIGEACVSYVLTGSPEATQARNRKFFQAASRNGQQRTYSLWAAQFNDYGWEDPTVTYTPAEGHTAYDDPKVRATFEKYYNIYARMAPYIDRLIAQFYDAGSLTDRQDVFKYMKLLEKKFHAVNPKIAMAINSWATPPKFLDEFTQQGFKDIMLLELSMPYQPGQREHIHELAKKKGWPIGMWSWYRTGMESDQYSAMFVNAKILKHFFQEIKNGICKIQPFDYWSEMESHHLNNIYSHYVAGALLWNPELDPQALLSEVSDCIWGPRNGPKVCQVLNFIQDMRSGEDWYRDFWWDNPQHKFGTDNPAEDARRGAEALAILKGLKTDEKYVPKFPLPFPPETFIDLMIPQVEQIRLFAEFRVRMDKIRAAAKEGADQGRLTAMLTEAWKPVPEFDTWIGMYGQIECRMQYKMVHQLADELKIKIEDPVWLRTVEANRLLDLLKLYQRKFSVPPCWFNFKISSWNEFAWPEGKLRDRMQKLLDEKLVEKKDEGTYRLTDLSAAFLHP